MAYIGSRPDNVISRNAQNEYNYTATGGQTTFTGADSNNNTLSYTPGNIEVYFNGARLEESDFTATNGTSIVLANAAVVNDELSIVAIRVFEVGSISNFNTSDLAEGSNLYFTNARVDARIAAADTDDLSEGSTNLYFTNARADARAQLKVDAIVGSAPGTLDTLQELGDALGDDPNFATTVTNSIATKLPLSGGAITGNVTFGVNNKAIFGASSDLQIYHDGSNSHIKDTATGNLNISGNDIQILNAASNEAMAYFAQDGDVTLYHNGVAKLATTSTGLNVTGGVTSDGLTVDGAASIGSDTAKTKFYSDSTYNGIYNGSSLTSEESIYMGGDTMFFYTDGSEAMRILSSGNVGIGTTNPTVKLTTAIAHSNGAVAEGLKLTTDGSYSASNSEEAGPAISFGQFHTQYPTWKTGQISGIRDGSSWNGSLSFWTNNGSSETDISEKMRITGAGNVGIGTLSPVKKLEVAGDIRINDANSLFFKRHGDNYAWRMRNESAADNSTYGFSGTNKLVFEVVSNSEINALPSATSHNIYPTSANTLVLTEQGRVGIGTNSPSNKLDIKGTVGFEATNSTNSWLAYTYTDNTFRINYNGAGADEVTITSSGNVGIGNLLPVHPLHIYEDGGYYASIGRGNSTPGGSDPWLGLFNNTNIANATFGWGIYDSNANGSFQIWNKNNNTTGYDALTILRGGNVGIGTDNPTSNLHVDGSIVSTNLAQGTGELQIQGYGATGYINMSGSGSLKFRMGSSYTEHMSLTSGGQLLASAAGRYTGLNSNAWVTFGRLYGAQSTPLNIKVIVGHNSSGGYNEFTNDTYAYNIAAGTVVTIGNTTGGYTCQIRKIKRIGGQNGIPGAHYNGGDGGWEYQVARNQAYGMSVGIQVMGATTAWTWTI
jgi:hypothetical protein